MDTGTVGQTLKIVFEGDEDISDDEWETYETNYNFDSSKVTLKVPTSYTLGMVNGDENIDASDALMALQHSVKLITLEDSAFKAADVTGDNTVDASDALLILQYSVKLIGAEDFPAAKK